MKLIEIGPQGALEEVAVTQRKLAAAWPASAAPATGT